MPLRYTASYSTRRTSRTARGKRCEVSQSLGALDPDLDGCKAMASLLTTRGENLAPTRCLHARAEAVGFVTTAHFGLKGAFWQRELL